MLVNHFVKTMNKSNYYTVMENSVFIIRIPTVLDGILSFPLHQLEKRDAN